MYHIGCNHICPNGVDPNDESGNTRRVRLKFLREELLYDIRNYAYIEGHVMGEERQHAQHTLVEIGEEGNIDRVLRILSVVHAATVEMLYPYTKESPIEDDEELDDKQDEPAAYVIEMRVPVTFSRTTMQLLSRLIHEFMVYRVLADWLSITNPEASQNWYVKSQEVESEINSIKNLRTGVLTRPNRPF